MNTDTTIENVKSQLMYEWDEATNEDGEVVDVKGKQLMTDAEAQALIESHKDIFDHCKMMRSFSYYTANQIRNASNLNK